MDNGVSYIVFGIIYGDNVMETGSRDVDNGVSYIVFGIIYGDNVMETGSRDILAGHL